MIREGSGRGAMTSAPRSARKRKKHARASPAMRLCARRRPAWPLPRCLRRSGLLSPMTRSVANPVAKCRPDLHAGGPPDKLDDERPKRERRQHRRHQSGRGDRPGRAPVRSQAKAPANRRRPRRARPSPSSTAATASGRKSCSRRHGRVPRCPGAIDPRLLEMTRHGQIPRIGVDGTRGCRCLSPARSDAAKPQCTAHRHRHRPASAVSAERPPRPSVNCRRRSPSHSPPTEAMSIAWPARARGRGPRNPAAAADGAVRLSRQ